MTHPLPPGGPEAGVAGAAFGGPAPGAADFLPFTGSILTLPLALLGLALTFAGWLLTRLGADQ